MTPKLAGNLRHLRALLAVVETCSVTQAARRGHVSQPAVTQAIAKFEQIAATPLFSRTSQGLFATPAGDILGGRIGRALAHLDPALASLSPRLKLTATAAQLDSFCAVTEAQNFTLAARRLGLAQPTVHRAVSQIEVEAGRPLFERTPHGMIATRPAQALAQAARLAFAELDQAEADLAEITAREVGRIVIGAMPLSRSYLLPQAIAAFRQRRRNLPIQIVEASYDGLLAGLRRGDIDFLVGAMRSPAPIDDIEQRPMFEDTLVLVAGLDHPLAGRARIEIAELASYPFVVGSRGAPIRSHFDALFADAGSPPPASIVESGSVILMRELLDISDHLGCISRRQAEAEIARGLMAALPIDLDHTARTIGVTIRRGWLPTVAQREFLDLLGLDNGPGKAGWTQR